MLKRAYWGISHWPVSCIDPYFLRGRLYKSSEAQHQQIYHSPQCINTPYASEYYTSCKSPNLHNRIWIETEGEEERSTNSVYVKKTAGNWETCKRKMASSSSQPLRRKRKASMYCNQTTDYIPSMYRMLECAVQEKGAGKSRLNLTVNTFLQRRRGGPLQRLEESSKSTWETHTREMNQLSSPMACNLSCPLTTDTR